MNKSSFKDFKSKAGSDQLLNQDMSINNVELQDDLSIEPETIRDDTLDSDFSEFRERFRNHLSNLSISQESMPDIMSELKPIELGRMVVSPDLDDEPENIRDVSVHEDVLEFREKLGKLCKVSTSSEDSPNPFDDEHEEKLPSDIEDPPTLGSILSDQDSGSSPPLATSHRRSDRDSFTIGRSTTAIRNVMTSSPETDSEALDESMEEIDVLDLLQVKTPTTKMEQELKLKREKNSKKNKKADLRRYLTL